MSNINEKITSQQALVEKIKLLQAEEKTLRTEILEELFGENNLGTVKTVAGEFVVTGTYGQTYKLSQDEIESALEDDLLSEEAQEAIRVKFELDKKAYDSLSDDVAGELDEYLIVKPSLPTLKVKPYEPEEE
ncbi:hypothetical protein S1R3Y_000024 [Vibrio phage vB_ValP_VA-RY-3]|nr:hypothetical protein S1R3Y_000024 [Vibrio phage vB_ValP_VA-RY-3]